MRGVYYRIPRCFLLAVLLALALYSPLHGGEWPPEADTYRALKSLERQIVKVGSQVEPDSYTSILEAMEMEARKLLYLMVDGRPYQASKIFWGKYVEKGFICKFLAPDDTIHVTEFPDFVIPVPLSTASKVSVTVFPARTESPPRFYIGDPEEMHASGYDQVVPVTERDDGTLELAPPPAGKQFLLFTMVKNYDELLHRKYVWVIERGKE
ncbi:MAG: hypothetical protein RDV48_23795 [Candidatus Eremiobacteraeota bacterium]|nr:hypothetical protein [Candidatus Eremiobacteraeota bacterium]